MRIAQVTNLVESVPPANKNGLEMVVSYLTEELVKQGHEVTLFATADSITSAKLIPVWPRAVSRDTMSQNFDNATFTRLVVGEVLKRYQDFDIIHDHTRFLAPHFAKLISTPIVSTLHHPISFIYESGYKETFPADYQPYIEKSWGEARKNVQTVCVSQFQANEYAQVCSVVHNGLNLADFKFNPNPGDYFAFLGYISPTKGAAQAIQAILPTKEKLLIAGPIRDDDPAGQEYFEKAIKPFLSDRIKYLGGLDYQQKIDFLLKAKAVLMPIQWDEPFGLVAIEALACGTPVIAWNRAAMPEIISEGVTGFLTNSVENMSQKILQVGSLSRSAARKQVEEKFTSEIMANKYIKLYENLRLLSK